MTKFKKLTKEATVTFCRNPRNYNKTKVMDTITSFLLLFLLLLLLIIIIILSFVFDSVFHIFRDSTFRRAQ